ncbi:MAG: AsmA-like C-terminal region-containing protein, partial [Pedobacter sp.]|nr:AsmA-like C-terminal region-containing protein [Pedobacter sp.]
EGLQSEALKIQASYKAPGMTDATASISTAIKTDWRADTLSLQKLSLISGNKQWQLDGDLKASLAEKSLHAERLVIRYSTSDKSPARELDISNLLLSASGEASQPQLSLSGNIGEGQFRIPLQAKLTPASADIKASLSASNIDIKNLRSWLDDKEATGHLDMEAKLEAAGQSWEGLQQQAAGNLKLTLQNGFLGSISIMSVLRERLQGYASLLPELAPDDGNEKGTALRGLEMQLSLKEGVLSTEKFQADIDLARVAASGRYDSKSGLIDYQGKLDLDRRLFTGKNGLELPLLCQGNIKEEQVDFLGGLETDCKVDDKAKQDLLARALINRFRS